MLIAIDGFFILASILGIFYGQTSFSIVEFRRVAVDGEYSSTPWTDSKYCNYVNFIQKITVKTRLSGEFRCSIAALRSFGA